jgi:hypothetical protein
MLAAGILNLLLLKEREQQTNKQTKMGLNLIFTHSDAKQGSVKGQIFPT